MGVMHFETRRRFGYPRRSPSLMRSAQTLLRTLSMQLQRGRTPTRQCGPVLRLLPSLTLAGVRITRVC